MEYYPLNKIDTGFHVEGFPDAAKLIKLEGKKARRLADLVLHKGDLEFALSCLENIEHKDSELILKQVKDSAVIIRQGLWHSAIMHFMKCFGQNNSRFGLNSKNVYKGQTDAIEVFAFFKALRDKHLVHDENAYSQCHPGAVLNMPNSECKIAKIMCTHFVGFTLDEASYSNLHLLVSDALKWVVTEFDNLCEVLTGELEAEPYEKLEQMELVVLSKPTVDEINSSRSRP